LRAFSSGKTFSILDIKTKIKRESLLLEGNIDLAKEQELRRAYQKGD